MERKAIKLTAEKELKIFMDPIRQRVLRTMEIIGTPITAKKLADELSMTPASAKHHLTQLESIGLVELDHTEIIHGINAKYYRVTDVEIRLGLEDNEFRTEREIIAENQVISVFHAFTKNIYSYGETKCASSLHGDCHTGVVRLTEQQFLKLHEDITRFISENQSLSEGATAYEFALVYCRARQKK
jgi:DNA-binding transcriptional ArsR family regulator